MPDLVMTDAWGHVTEVHHVDEMEDKGVIKYTQDVEPTLDRNKAEQNDGPQNIGKWGRKVASIPPVVLMKWMQEDGVNIWRLPKRERAAYLRRKVYSPENRHLLTSPHK